MEQLQLLWVARSCVTPQSGVKAHTHPYYHMIYIETGVCSMVAGDQHHSLNQGQCILIPPHTEHSYSNETPVTVDYLEIKFTAANSIPLRISDSAPFSTWLSSDSSYRITSGFTVPPQEQVGTPALSRIQSTA